MRFLVTSWLLLVQGCSLSHLAPGSDAGAPALVDAGALPADAGASTEPAVELAVFELPPQWSVWDAVATVDGDVCVGGGGAWVDGEPPVPEVGPGDAFVACFDVGGMTRSRAWSCPGRSSSAHRLATNASGDLFVLLDGGCGGPSLSVSIERLDRALATRATMTVTSPEIPTPYLRGLGATDQHVVVSGSLRSAARIGEYAAHGPVVAILDASDLSVVRVLGSPPGDGRRESVSIDHLAVRDDGVALLFGRDIEGGVFAPESGSFVRAVGLPDGELAAPALDRRWHHRYEALWHPDGRPVVIGTFRGARTMQVDVGGELFALDTDYAASPNARFRGDELLVARPFFDRFEIAGRTFTGDLWGGFLVAVDSTTLEPRWARGLPGNYGGYLIEVLVDDTIAVVGRGPVDDRSPGMRLAFYR